MSESSLVIIKPDGMQRSLAGSIISRFESKGLSIVAARLMRITVELAREHYEAHAGKYFFDRAVSYLSAAPVLVMVFQGTNAVAPCRGLSGATFGCEASPGTIRGDYSSSEKFNLVHTSDSPEAAQREIALYFKPEEILDYELCAEKWL